MENKYEKLIDEIIYSVAHLIFGDPVLAVHQNLISGWLKGDTGIIEMIREIQQDNLIESMKNLGERNDTIG